MAGALNVHPVQEPEKIGSGLSLECLEAIAKERPVFLFSVPHQHKPKYDPLLQIVIKILRENAGRCRHLKYQSLAKLGADEYRTVYSPVQRKLPYGPGPDYWVTRQLSESARQKIANFVFKALRQHKVAESSPKSFPESDVGACGETTARGSKRTFSNEDTEILPRNDYKRAKTCKVQNNFSRKEVILSNFGYDFSDSVTVYHEPIYVRSVNFMQNKNFKREVYSNDKSSSEVKEVTEQVHSLPDFNDTNFGSNASLSIVSVSSEEICINKGSVEPVRERGDPDTFKICKSEESPAACETQDGDFHNIQIFPTEFKSCSQGEFPNAVLEFASLTRNAFPVHVA
nr:PREDICTED: uncharacterized protein LOC109033303 [Bemisia tabaci]